MKTYLFFWGEVIYDVEELTDFLWCFSLDHVCDSLASNITTRYLVSVIDGIEKDGQK